MYSYPHTITSQHGEELTFVQRVRDEKGEYLEVRNRVHPGSGPPMHVHYLQDEGLTVEKGRIGYQVLGQESEYAEEGETVIFSAGTPHKFWNAGDSELVCSGFIRPPDSIEYFLTSIYDSMNRTSNGRPDPFDAAFLLGRYGSEFGMNEVPPFVQRFIFPVMRLVGRVSGKYRKFADAPEPVQRRI